MTRRDLATVVRFGKCLPQNFLYTSCQQVRPCMIIFCIGAKYALTVWYYDSDQRQSPQPEIWHHRDIIAKGPSPCSYVAPHVRLWTISHLHVLYGYISELIPLSSIAVPFAWSVPRCAKNCYVRMDMLYFY